MKNLGILSLLITQPRKAFAELDAEPRFLFPLMLALATTIGMLLWYYAVVDFDWLIDQTLSSSPRTASMSETQRAQAAAILSRNVLMWTSLGAGVLAVVLLRIVEAVYLMLAGKITNVQRSFKHWFALGCWSSLPPLVALIPAAVLIIMRQSNQFASDVLQPLSLNSLFLHRGMGAPGYTLLTTLSPLQLVAWWLSIVGVKTWSGRSWLFSAIYVLLPILLCYGGWAWFALARS